MPLLLIRINLIAIWSPALAWARTGAGWPDVGGRGEARGLGERFSKTIIATEQGIESRSTSRDPPTTTYDRRLTTHDPRVTDLGALSLASEALFLFVRHLAPAH